MQLKLNTKNVSPNKKAFCRIFFIATCLFCCWTFDTYAQLPGIGGGSTLTGTISGQIIDSLTKQPLDYATVGIMRRGGKTPITGVVTDPKGFFKLEGIKPGDYTISIGFVGYLNKKVDVSTTPSKLDKNTGGIVLSSASKALNEVTVSGQKALIENHIDKLVYNAEKDLTAAGGSASDVLQKVPLVNIDLNGNVSIRGDGNVRVLINGKPSGATSTSLADVLKTIPAAQIKSIEVITSPSAKYDAEGTAGIINIITKQKNVSGISGSLTGGVGTRQNNGNFNLNYNKNRFSLTLNLGGNFGWPQNSLTSFNQTFYTNGAATQSNTNTINAKVKRHGTISSVNANYDFNSYNNISTSFRLNSGGYSSTGNSVNNFTNYTTSPVQTLNYTGTNSSTNSLNGFDWNLDYTHKFKQEGNELDFSTQWSHSKVNSPYSNIYSQQSATTPNQMSDNSGVNDEYTIQLDYILPLSKAVKFEAGGKSIFRKINSDFNVYKTQTLDPGDSTNFILDPVNSNVYIYNQNVFAGYGVFTFTLGKGYTIMPGARIENTDIKGDPINSLQTDLSPFSQNYNTFVPSLTIQKAFTAGNTLKLTYSKRITRPSLTFLNPFINATNPNAQTQGNPTLAPEVSQTVELNMTTFIGSSLISTAVYYKDNTGIIEGIAEPLTTAGGAGTITRYYNVGNNHSLGASIFGSFSPIKEITIRASMNAYTYQENSYSQYSSDQSQNGNYIAATGFLSGSVMLNGGFIAEVFAFENSSRHTIQGTTPALAILGAGIRKQILQKKASIGLNTLSPFSNYLHYNQKSSTSSFTQSTSSLYPLRSFGITFSYNFGKLSFSNPMQKQKKGVNNDDLKQGEQNPAGGTGGGAGPVQ